VGWQKLWGIWRPAAAAVWLAIDVDVAGAKIDTLVPTATATGTANATATGSRKWQSSSSGAQSTG